MNIICEFSFSPMWPFFPFAYSMGTFFRFAFVVWRIFYAFLLYFDRKFRRKIKKNGALMITKSKLIEHLGYFHSGRFFLGLEKRNDL